MTAADIAREAAGIVAVAAVGRIVLAWLPAGPPGLHGPRQLATTWAASYLCGVVALTLEQRALELLGLTPATWFVALPWALAGLARWLTLPAAMLPRHEPREERPGWLARALTVVLVAAVLLPFQRAAVAAPDEGLPFAARIPGAGPAAFAALVVLLGYGLERARRSPFARRLTIALFALTPVVQELAAESPLDVLVALCLGGGAACSIAWVRRADRRAAALATLGIAGAAVVDVRAAGAALALLGGVTLATAAPSRTAWLVRAGPAWVACTALGLAAQGAPSFAGGLLEHAGQLGRAMSDPGAWEYRWLVVPIAMAVLVWRLVRARERDASKPAVDATLPELGGLAVATALGWLALALCWDVPWRAALRPELWRHAALLPLAALATLVCGLALAPAERPRPNPIATQSRPNA